jgi:(Z)-2-((N-methylformamido)methylene)-5-hydroxybutyrolactone dehydrogenase
MSEETPSIWKMTIGGKQVPALLGATYASIDPYTGEPWALVPDGSERDVDVAVAAARAAFEGEWGEWTATQRGAALRRLGDLVAREAPRLAELETRDNGKLLREMAGQMAYLPEWFYYYGGLADKVAGQVIPSDKANYLVYTRNEPVGGCNRALELATVVDDTPIHRFFTIPPGGSRSTAGEDCSTPISVPPGLG